ncbi:18175_t:CDS:1, partial [Cetraspora pellucida]
EVEKVKGYFTERVYNKEEEMFANSWQNVQSLAAYLSQIKELLTTIKEDKKESIEEKIEKIEVSEELNEEEQKEAKKLLKKEREVFAQIDEKLEHANRTNH